MKKKYLDLISSVILILFGLWGWYDTSSWRIPASHDGISPVVYPRAVFTVIMLCAAIVLVRFLLNLKAPSEEMERVVDLHMLKTAGTVALMVIYIFAMSRIGFLFTTPVFLFLSMLFFGERNWLRMAVISLAGTAALYLFFVHVMKVQF